MASIIRTICSIAPSTRCSSPIPVPANVPTSNVAVSQRPVSNSIDPGRLILISSPSTQTDCGSTHYLFESATASRPTGSTNGRLLRPYDWESYIQYGTFPEARDSQHVRLEDLVDNDSDAEIGPSRERLGSIDFQARRYSIRHSAPMTPATSSQPPRQWTMIGVYEDAGIGLVTSAQSAGISQPFDVEDVAIEETSADSCPYRVYEQARRLDIQDQCHICQEMFESKGIVSVLRCAHIFHESCLVKAMPGFGRHRCPLCFR